MEMVTMLDPTLYPDKNSKLTYHKISLHCLSKPICWSDLKSWQMKCHLCYAHDKIYLSHFADGHLKNIYTNYLKGKITYRFIVQEDSRVEPLAKPFDNFPGLLRLHIHKHTLCQDNGGQTGVEWREGREVT